MEGKKEKKEKEKKKEEKKKRETEGRKDRKTEPTANTQSLYRTAVTSFNVALRPQKP